MKRKIAFYFLKVFIPSIFLVVLSWLSFWDDTSAVPAQVSLGVTCVLTVTTQSSGIRQILPPVSYAKAVDVWMFVCLLFVFVEFCVCSSFRVCVRQCGKHAGGNLLSTKMEAERKMKAYLISCLNTVSQ